MSNILFKSPAIDLLWYEYNVVFVICTQILDALKELNLQWDGEESGWEGATIWTGSTVYCLVNEDSNKRTVLHEAIHAINKIRFTVYSEVDLQKDETYVREVSWLQDKMLDMWEDYFLHEALKKEGLEK